MSSTAYNGLDVKERRKLWLALNPHHESNRLNEVDGLQVIELEKEYRRRTAVRSRTSDEVSKIKLAEPLLLSERLDALHQEVCTVNKEKTIRKKLILEKKIVARLGAYSHDRVPKDMSKWKLYQEKNPVFTLVFDACTALRSWFRMNKDVAFLDHKKDLRTMHSQLTSIIEACARDTSKNLLKYGEPITLYHLQSWVTIMHIHYMQLKESRMLQSRNIPVPNDLRFEIQMPFNLQGVLNSYETKMIPSTRPGSCPGTFNKLERRQSELTTSINWDTYVDAARPRPWRSTGNLAQTTQSVVGPRGLQKPQGRRVPQGAQRPKNLKAPEAFNVPTRAHPKSAVTPTLVPAQPSPGLVVSPPNRTPVRAPRRSAESRPIIPRKSSERVQYHAAMKRSMEEMPLPVPVPAPAPVPADSDSVSSIDHNIYTDSDDDESTDEDIRAELKRGFQPEKWDGTVAELKRSHQPEEYKKRILADLARRSQPEVVDVNDVVEDIKTDSEDENDEHDEAEDGDDSGDSDFQDADLEDGDDSEDSDYADQAPVRGNKRSVVKEPKELKAQKVPIKLSPLAAARKKMASQLKAGRHRHTRLMEEDNAKRVRTKMFEMTVS